MSEFPSFLPSFLGALLIHSSPSKVAQDWHRESGAPCMYRLGLRSASGKGFADGIRIDWVDKG